MKLYVRQPQTYDEVVSAFAWDIPKHFNLGVACCDAHPTNHPALTHYSADGSISSYTFGDITRLSNQLANVLVGLGLEREDRVAIDLPQSLETALANVAAFRANLISVPLSSLFGPDAIRFRLDDSAARVLVTDTHGLEKIEDVLPEMPDLEWVLLTDREPGKSGRLLGFWSEIESASDRFEVHPTLAEEPCVVLYTSGTTGPPKGVVHAHRVAWGHAPARQMSWELFPQPDDCVWTPADWAWTGGLISCLVSAWVHGVRVVSAERRTAFDPEWALDLMVDQGVTNGFLPPTALRMMMACSPRPGLRLRSASCGGEQWNTETLAAARRAMGGAHLVEGFGQTEADALAGCFPSGWEIRPGTAGRVLPGHELRIMREDDSIADVGEPGEIVLRLPDPTAMLRYLNHPEATEAKLRGGWLRTGDLGMFDDHGYLHFVSRADEVIKASGYRIGPGEVEACIDSHPAVKATVVVGAPDPMRGQIVKAYVLLKDAEAAGEDLKRELQAHVKENLGAYQYPRSVEFVDEFPLTTSGKADRGQLRRRAEREAELAGA